MEDLDSSSIWLLSEGHCFRDQTLKICRETAKKKNRAIQFNSGNLETLKQLVEQDFGMTLLPWTALDNNDDGKKRKALMKEFQEPVHSRKIRLYSSRKNLNLNIKQLCIEMIIHSIPE